MLSASESEWADLLARHGPRYAVLYEDHFNYLSKMCLSRMREAAFRMIRSAPACTVIVCSSDATDHSERYLAAGADYVILGEGEQTLVELLDALRRGNEPDEVAGLTFVRAGRVVRTRPRTVIRHLDELPFPAWDLVDVERYRSEWLRRHGYFSVNMVTSRGCPFHCNWCAKPIWGQRYNERSPENVVAELGFVKSHLRPDHIWFMDDIMGIKPGWMKRFAELVEAAGLRTPFKCLNRVDLLLRPGEIDALRRAGCDIVWTGVESGSRKILDAMEKGISVEEIRMAAARLHETGIRVGFFLQFGFPGEDREDIRRTFELVRACGPDQIGVSVSYPLPGTRFYEMVRAQLGEKQNWIDSDDLAMMYRGPFSTVFYRRLHRVLHKEFRARKALKALRRPISRDHLREAATLVFHAATLPLERLRMEFAARVPHEATKPPDGSVSREEAGLPDLRDPAQAPDRPKSIATVAS
jgi:radical SAM superfamily enzyme YgiQ (UPF0313 family)